MYDHMITLEALAH